MQLFYSRTHDHSSGRRGLTNLHLDRLYPLNFGTVLDTGTRIPTIFLSFRSFFWSPGFFFGAFQVRQCVIYFISQLKPLCVEGARDFSLFWKSCHKLKFLDNQRQAMFSLRHYERRGMFSLSIYSFLQFCYRQWQAVLNYLDLKERRHQLETSMKMDNKQVQFQVSSDNHVNNNSTVTESSATLQNNVPQFQHQRIRELHGDHQPLYIAPPPHFFPPFPQQEQNSTDKPVIKAPPLVRSVSAAELTTPRILAQQLKPLSARDLQPPPPVLATSSSNVVVTPTKGKRGRKPKDPVAHAAKKEAKEKRRLEKEAAAAAAAMAEAQQQQIVFVPEEIPPPPSIISQEQSSPPSTSGMSHLESQTPPPFSDENKKRTADTAFSGDMWLGEESIDVDSTWTMSTPLTSPIASPETDGLGMFLQAPPSTPIEEILSSSAQLGINPALLLQEDVFPSMKLGKAIRNLKSPLEIIDEYAPQSPIGASQKPSTPSEECGNKKLGLMDLMLLRSNNETEDKPNPKKKPRPDLVFSTTKRGKAIVSLQKNASTDSVVEPTTPVRESRPSDAGETDLRSLVLKRRQEVWGDEVGTEITRISVHRRLTARKTSTGLMSPLSPKFSAKRCIMDIDTDSSDSSDSEDEEVETTNAQVTPLATPTNPLVGVSQSMQKSFSAPGLFYPASENIFLPATPHQEDDDDEYNILSRSDTKPLVDDDSGMRCKTCGMLFRKQAVLTSHERTCMVKQTPFIPYDFLRSDHVDDGFVFGGGRQLFNEDIFFTPRNLAVQMGFESPLVQQKGEQTKRIPSTTGFVAPRDTVSSEEDNEEVKEATKVVGEPRGSTRCICNKPEKAVAGVMVQWFVSLVIKVNV